MPRGQRARFSSDVCALIDRSTHLVEPYSSLVLQALLAPFPRLSLATLSRESCLCTWRLTRLWTDVRIFLHLWILGTCRWDLIKDLSTWLPLPLHHDWNVHNSVCELPRISVLSGSLALVFALHELASACSRKYCQLCRWTVPDASPLISVIGLGRWNFPL